MYVPVCAPRSLSLSPCRRYSVLMSDVGASSSFAAAQRTACLALLLKITSFFLRGALSDESSTGPSAEG